MAVRVEHCSIGFADSGQFRVQPEGPLISATAIARSGLLASLALEFNESVQLPLSKEQLSAWLLSVDGPSRVISIPQLLLALEVCAALPILTNTYTTLPQLWQ